MRISQKIKIIIIKTFNKKDKQYILGHLYFETYLKYILLFKYIKLLFLFELKLRRD